MGWVEAQDPHATFRAAASADADLGRSARRIAMAPGSLRRGLVKLSMNKFTRRVFRRGCLECYDVGHLYNLAYFVDRDIIEPPLFI